MSEIPEWAMARVGEICQLPPKNIHDRSWWWTWDCMKHFARYIAEHEEPPVDPLLIEAREIVDSDDVLGAGVDLNTPYGSMTGGDIQDGKHDNSAIVQIALLALRRGIEIGKADA